MTKQEIALEFAARGWFHARDALARGRSPIHTAWSQVAAWEQKRGIPFCADEEIELQRAIELAIGNHQKNDGSFTALQKDGVLKQKA